MEKKEILKYVDHTLLTQSATWEEIRQILDFWHVEPELAKLLLGPETNETSEN